MQALYQLDVQGSEIMVQLHMHFFREAPCDQFTRTQAYEWTKGTWEHVSLCDELITPAILQWQFSRLSPVDKSILRLAVYQFKFCPSIPPKVVINEGIELAKKYSSDKSPGFINGVLDAVLKKLPLDSERDV